MKALVTGANGHIGVNLVAALAERDYGVRATVRSLAEAERNATLASLPGVELVELDIRDADRFRSLCDNVDVVFHLAATYAYHPGTRTTEDDVIADSVAGAEAAIRAAARQVRKVVLTSSIVAVPLRSPQEPPSTEEDWQTDFSVPYFRAKTMAEQRAWSLAEKYGVDLVTVLPGAVCGPGFTRGTPSTDVIKGIMLGTLRFGAPRMTFPMVDVRDVVRGHILAAERPVSGRFLLCPDEVLSLLELTRIMNAIDPAIPAAAGTMPDFMGGILPHLDWINSKIRHSPLTLTAEFVHATLGKQFKASNDRARALLGWRPEVPAQQTLSDTIDAIRTRRRDVARKH